ncbi:hypothetical protein LMG28138_01686 [Pararobbsia alpina]|uniref:Uncharacterized protein n=1 Tax=Pararobbsia alpina TaxID=621374 RepID=A0A6S7BBT8_9BURK|nr:hypothetical protein LMG28138_01686 [Pararobbsia alpina]
MRRPMRTELVSENGTKVVHLEIDTHRMQLGAEDLDVLIEQLGALRASMRPPVPSSVSRTHRYSVELDPSWYAEPHPGSDAVVLFLRNSGVGWAGFAIPRDKALRFCEDLAIHANAPARPLGLAS